MHLAAGAGTTLLVLPRLDPERREQRIRLWCGKFLTILNIRVTVYGRAPTEATRRALLVSNHISWIDIWALKQLHPLRFVAKSDIRGWPLIGWLAAQTGTLFIERERRRDTGRVMNGVEQALRQDDCLCFFPEGTTSDGSEVKPFKSSLFQAAINAGAEVWPVALRYPAADGGPNTAVAYCGDITLWQSLRAVLRQQEIRVEVYFAPPLAAAGQERRHLSHRARHAIVSALHPNPRTVPGTHAGPPAASR